MNLSAENRSTLRKAIVAHSGWESYKKARGDMSISAYSKDELIGAANALGIDIRAIIDGRATNATSTEKTGGTYVFDEVDDSRDDHKAIPVVASPSFDKNDAGKPIWDLVRGHAVGEIFDHIKPAIEKALSNVSTIKIEMTSNGVAVGESTGHHHPSYATLCRALSCRSADGFFPNVWIAGPAGSGKTHAARSFAKAAGLEFYYNGALRDAFELLGYMDASGVYHTTPFRQAYEHGGVYLFDEVDGSDNAALLALNGALANGIAAFPNGMIERHPDCRIIATGNTWGLGATSDYVGRGKIDAAFLDRFGVRMSWDYDVALEVAISGNADFARRVQSARERARAAGLKVLITPRASIAGAALIAAGFTHDEAAGMTYLANLSNDQKKIIEGRA
jgi:cobaltochelatase CobS